MLQLQAGNVIAILISGITVDNNDLTVSERVGDVWACSFEGRNIAVIAPKEPGAGSMEIFIDGNSQSIVDLSTVDVCLPQQVVFQMENLVLGKHTLSIVNRKGKVSVDACKIY